MQIGFELQQSHYVEDVQIWSFSGPYSVRMWENTDQKKVRIWTLFTQCFYHHLISIYGMRNICLLFGRKYKVKNMK